MVEVKCIQRLNQGSLKTIFIKILFFSSLTSFTNPFPDPKYISIAFFKSTSPDFIQHEKSFWLPIQQELIKAGRKDAWYMYKISSPSMNALPFDYIRFNVFHNKEQTKDPYAGMQQFIELAYPGKDMSEQMKMTNNTRTVVWEQLYEIKGSQASSLSIPNDLLLISINPMNPSKNNRLKLIAIEPFKKENLYTELEIVDSKKRMKGDGLLCEVVVTANDK